MIGKVLARLSASLVVVWAAATVAFLLVQAMPGSTVDVLLARSQASEQVRGELIKQYQLNDSLAVQYLTFLRRTATGNFGDSFVMRRPVTDAIGETLSPTLQLLVVALAITVVVGTGIAVLSASGHRWVSSWFSAIESLVVAVPPFWLGLMLLSIFSFSLHWFPAIGAEGTSGLVLPGIALAAAPTAIVASVLRDGLVRTSAEPFVLSARSRGVSELGLRIRHILRHAMIPVVSLIGWVAGSLVGGAVVVEIVFSRPGIGRVAVNAVQNKDMPLVIGVVLLTTVVFVLTAMIADIITWLLDPRTREPQ